MPFSPDYKWFKRIEGFIYYDVGQAWNHPETGGQLSTHGMSAGGGIRVHMTHWWYWEFEVGKPFASNSDQADTHGWNYFFNLNFRGSH